MQTKLIPNTEFTVLESRPRSKITTLDRVFESTEFKVEVSHIKYTSLVVTFLLTIQIKLDEWRLMGSDRSGFLKLYS